MNAHLRRSPRYVLVSLFCMGLSNAILIAADRLGFSSAAVVILSAVVLIPVGFLFQARVTFAIRPNLEAFSRYAAALALNVPLSWLVLFLTHDLAGLDMVLAAPLATVLLFLWTYFVSSWALARRSPHPTEGTLQ
ncbi:GtrA family protein [Sphingobium sp. AN558]|uniref:GtrA family protein n=1 Tax=Sphingobium sp. AN558 TaxID=3133442 RepID=UPI0030C4B2D7